MPDVINVSSDYILHSSFLALGREDREENPKRDAIPHTLAPLMPFHNWGMVTVPWGTWYQMEGTG